MRKMKSGIRFILVSFIVFCWFSAFSQDDIDKVVNRLLNEKKSVSKKRESTSESGLPASTERSSQTWEFVTEGSADYPPGTDKTLAREKAVKDALRNAVEQGVGVFLGSTTLVRNYQVAFDSILSQSAGYVRTYKILKEWEADGLYHVRVLAEVGMGKLQSDLLAIETFKKLVEYPRIIVFGKEKVDGELRPDSRLVQTAIESVLAESGYDLIDRSQIEEIKNRDFEMAETDEERAALGRRFGADILITYSAEATSAGRDNIYGMLTYFYTGVVDCRVIKSDTGRLMFSRSVRVRRGAEGAPSAAQAALHFAGKSMGENLKVEVLRHWAGEVLERGTWLEVKISNIDFSTAMQLTDKIQQWQHINAVRRPTFIKGTAIYQVRANMTAPTLAQHLSSLTSPRLEIDEVMQNSIKAHTVTP